MTYIEKCGFSLVRKQRLDELDADLYELCHTKSGASLVYLDREDDNKSFAIGFATPPQDDTGVFHIIEHSVLCGSEKYPLNDPFAELLKGSLNTFLNAKTDISVVVNEDDLCAVMAYQLSALLAYRVGHNDLYLITLAFSPSHIHTEQHFRPVFGFCSTGCEIYFIRICIKIQSFKA